MKTHQRSRVFIFFTVMMIAFLSSGFTQSCWADYPEKPITLIIDSKAGGLTDSLARILSKSLQEQLGQPVLESYFSSELKRGSPETIST